MSGAGWSESEVYEQALTPEHIEQLRQTGELVIQWEGVGESPPGLDEYGVEVRLNFEPSSDGSEFRIDGDLE